MEPYLTYVIGGLLVVGWVLLETWCDYRKLDNFDSKQEREELIIVGIANAIVYGTFWPTTLILFVLGKFIENPRGK